MQLPFVSRRQHEAVLADRERIRSERDQFATDRDAIKAAARDRNLDALEEHDVHRKALADALGDQMRHLNWDQLIADVVRLNKAAHQWMADYEVEKKRADHLETGSETGRLKRRLAQLQRRLDDAVGLAGRFPEDSGRRQPGYQQPKPTKETTP